MFMGPLELHVDRCVIQKRRLAEAAGHFTLKAQFIPLGSIFLLFAVDESHADELFDLEMRWGIFKMTFNRYQKEDNSLLK